MNINEIATFERLAKIKMNHSVFKEERIWFISL